MEKKIEIIVGTATTRDGKKTFNTYKAVQKDGKLIDCRFTKAVGAIPEKFNEITVELDDINIDKTRRFPVLWVKAVKEFGFVEKTRNNPCEDLF